MPANQNTVSAVRAYRLLRVVIHLLHAALVAACIYPFVGPATRGRRLQRWSAGLLQILAVRLCVSGVPPAGGAVLAERCAFVPAVHWWKVGKEGAKA
jgi:hypothetical protein